MSDGEQPETPAPPAAKSAGESNEPASWGARFGWIAGGLIGLVAGFFATYGVEKLVLHRTNDPLGIATKLSSVIVPAFFLAGALGGHAFGGRGGATRYKWLGVASGVLISTVAWAALVLLRR